MKLKWNIVIAVAIAALNYFNKPELIPHELTRTWMTALYGFVSIAQVAVAAIHTPDGKRVAHALEAARMKGIAEGRQQN
jgi:hypothetical protein